MLVFIKKIKNRWEVGIKKNNIQIINKEHEILVKTLFGKLSPKPFLVISDILPVHFTLIPSLHLSARLCAIINRGPSAYEIQSKMNSWKYKTCFNTV